VVVAAGIIVGYLVIMAIVSVVMHSYKGVKHRRRRGLFNISKNQIKPIQSLNYGEDDEQFLMKETEPDNSIGKEVPDIGPWSNISK